MAPPRPATVALLVLALALAGCGGRAKGSPAPAATPALGAAPLVERTPAAFTADLGRLHGRVVVVNFWASWCAPCRAEMPALERASRAYAGKRVTFIGVDASDERAKALAFLQRTGVTYPTVWDRKGLYGGVASAWAVSALPQTWFLRPDGSRAGHLPSQVTEAQVRAKVDQLLAE